MSKRNLNRFTLAAILTAISVTGVMLIVSGCRSNKGSAPGSAIRLGGPKNIAMLPIIADVKGYFRDEAVTVEYRPLQTGKIAQDALVSGDIDLGVLVDSNIAFIRFQGENDIRVVCTIQEKHDDALVARRDRGITKPTDLTGKKIGYLPATTSHIFLARYLAKQGVDINGVTLVSMSPPAMQAAVIRGDVDAISAWQPFRFNAMKELGGNGVEFNDESAYVAYALIAGRSRFFDARTDECKRVLRALLRAEEFVEKNTDEAIAILADKIPMERDALQAAWKEYRVRVRLDQGILKLVEEEGRWIAETQDGFKGKPVPDYSITFDATLLRNVAPDRVLLQK
jgi:NitT/TauT family transport system substrate-binding protein